MRQQQHIAQAQGGKRELRRKLRILRCSVNPTVQQTHANTVADLLAALPCFIQAKYIALYIPFDGEMPTDAIANLIWRQGKLSYLPIVTPMQSQLCFVPYTQHSQLTNNQFGIAEPDYTLDKIIDINQLDIVITPLIAFDDNGNRLGMGGGYYDKTFAFLRTLSEQHPQLMGIAYDFQRQTSLPKHTWDVPLTAVITEKKVYEFADNGE